jgi:hypothetical protein
LTSFKREPTSIAAIKANLQLEEERLRRNEAREKSINVPQNPTYFAVEVDHRVAKRALYLVKLSAVVAGGCEMGTTTVLE